MVAISGTMKTVNGLTTAKASCLGFCLLKVWILEPSRGLTMASPFGAVHSSIIQTALHACGEDIEVLGRFTYSGSVVHNNGTVGLTRKSFGGLVLPTVLWNCSMRVYSVAGTNAGGQRSTSSSSLYFPFYCEAVRHGHLPET